MRDVLPKLDQITFEVGQEPTVALLRLERGEVDVVGDGLPPLSQNPAVDNASIVTSPRPFGSAQGNA